MSCRWSKDTAHTVETSCRRDRLNTPTAHCHTTHKNNSSAKHFWLSDSLARKHAARATFPRVDRKNGSNDDDRVTVMALNSTHKPV